MRHVQAAGRKSFRTSVHGRSQGEGDTSRAASRGPGATATEIQRAMASSNQHPRTALVRINATSENSEAQIIAADIACPRRQSYHEALKVPLSVVEGDLIARDSPKRTPKPPDDNGATAVAVESDENECLRVELPPPSPRSESSSRRSIRVRQTPKGDVITTLEPDNRASSRQSAPEGSGQEASSSSMACRQETSTTARSLKRRSTSSIHGIQTMGSSGGDQPPNGGGRGPGGGDDGPRGPKRTGSKESVRIKAVGDEQPLPPSVEVPPRLMGRPLQEVDPYLIEPTFCVISKRFSKLYLSRFHASSSLFLFSAWNPVRQIAIRVATSMFFDAFIMCVILSNCIFLAMREPPWFIEFIFLPIYCLEMIIKVIAKGFLFHKYSYLRSPWNWLDFVVIVSGLMTDAFQLDLGNFNVLRAFRVLRALKTISIFPGLRTIINALLSAMKQLADVLALTLFCLAVFALFALHVYQGILKNKCVRRYYPELEANFSVEAYSTHVRNEQNWLYWDEEPIICGNGSMARNCPKGYVCLKYLGENPNFGYTNFDNFLWSLINTFRLITLDAWEDVYNKVLDAEGPFHVVFFALVVFFGAFYLLNLVLAVVADAYEKENQETERLKLETKDIRDLEKASTFSFHIEAVKQPQKNIKPLTREWLKSKNKQLQLASHYKNVLKNRRGSPSKSAFAQYLPTKLGDIFKQRSSLTTRAGDYFRKKFSLPSGQKSTVTTAPFLPRQDSTTATESLLNNKTTGLDGSEGAVTTTVHDVQETSGSVGRRSPRRRQSTSGSSLAPASRSGAWRQASVDFPKMQSTLSPPPPGVSWATCTSYHANAQFDHGRRSTIEIPRTRSCDSVSSKPSGQELPASSGTTSPKIESRDVRGASLPIPEAISDQPSTDAAEPAADPPVQRHQAAQQESHLVVNFGEDPSRHGVNRRLPHQVSMADSGIEGDDEPEQQPEPSVNVHVPPPSAYIEDEKYGMPPSPYFMDLNGYGPFAPLKPSELSFGDMQRKCSSTAAAAGGFGNERGNINGGGRKLKHWFSCSLGNQCLERWRPFQEKLLILVTDSCFETLIALAIVCNTALLGVTHHNMSEELKISTELANNIFNWIFTVEAVLKLAAMGKDYFATSWNIFDLVVVTASYIEFFLSDLAEFSAFRTFRLLRIFRLAKSWVTMRALLAIIVNTLGSLVNLTGVLIIVIYIFAVMGMQVFADVYKDDYFDGDCPRWNFTDFFHSFLMIFRILCGEWIEPLWDCMRGQERQGQAKEMCLMLFLPVLVMGNFLILNLFLALLLSSFNSDVLKDMEEELRREAPPTRYELLRNVLIERWASLIGRGKDSEAPALPAPGFDDNLESDDDKDKKSHAMAVFVKKGPRIHVGASETSNPAQSKLEPADCCPRICSSWSRCCRSVTPMWIMWIRRKCLALVQHWVFETFIMGLIVASSVALCFEDIYLEQKPYLTDVLHYLNIFFATTFSAEMGLKIVAFGFWQYFTNFWTLLDFFIVVISLTVLAADEVGQEFVAFRGLRTLRALRPLRAISRWEGMKVVVNALMHAIPSILNVIFVCLVFWLVFAILGVELFAGKFYECLDSDGDLLPVHIVQNKSQCLLKNYTWVNAKINFDNVGMAYIALFQVATFEGWLDIVEDAMDSRGVDQQPERDNNQYASIYFVIFIICGSFFTLNLFIGVIIDNFNALKKRYEGRALEMLLTESQKHYYAALKKLSRKRPQRVIRRPRNKYQAWFYDLSMSRRFEMVVFALIFANMVVMAIEHDGMLESTQEILEYCNMTFIFLFTLEACTKLVGLRYWYFTVPWNIFDFIILCLSSIAVMLDKMRSFSFPLNPVLLRVTRIFRVGRVLRLIRAAKGIRKLLFALAISLPALLNIGALLLLITFVYAILGMALFGHVAHNGAITATTNFETFSRSMYLLFRLLTAAGWNEVLESLMISPPECDEAAGNCGSPGAAVIYFVSFIIINNLIIINMYIAIILENFSLAQEEEELGIVEDDIEMFYVHWAKFDPHATQFIHFEQLSDFLSDIEPPLQIKKPNLLAMVYFDLPICRGNKVHCLDALHALVTHVLGEVDETEELKTLQEKMDEKFKKQFPERKKIEIVLTTTEWYRRERAANTIARSWRSYKTRKVQQLQQQTSSDGPVRTPSFRLREGLKNMAAMFGSQRARTPSRQGSERSDQSTSNLNGSTMHLPLPFPFSRRSSRASSRGSHHSLDSSQGALHASVILHSLMFPEADEHLENAEAGTFTDDDVKPA